MVKTLMNDVAAFLNADQSMACIHCGLCLSACPTYLETGNENDSPRGRIHLMRALQDGRLALDERPVRHLDLCLGCRACEAACPSGVEYGQLLERTREFIEGHHSRKWWDRLLRRVAIEKVFPFPARMKLALLPVRILRALRLERLMPGRLRDAMDLVPRDIEAVTLPEKSPAHGPAPRSRVGFISGCVMSVMFGRTQLASLRLLNRAGHEVITPRDQVCCGALYAHGGNLKRARECARMNIAAFENRDLDAIIINSAGCGSTLKEYGHLLQDDATWAQRARRFSERVKDLTEWLALHPPELRSPGEANVVQVTCHDACHLVHAQQVNRAPRDLLRSVAGDAFVEMPESDVCCGSAGSYNLTEPEMAERLQRRKTGNILRSGARVVITTNPGCLLQIQAGLRKAGAVHIRAVHLADYLAEHLPD
jgi:glycolate oxidase iron-sulfur subunit